MALLGPFISRLQQFEMVQGFHLNRVVDFLNAITDGTYAFNLPAGSSTATIPPTNYGTIPLKFDEKTPSGVNSVTFTPPSNFSHLQLKGQVRSSAAVVGVNLTLNFNGDTSSSYLWQQVYGNNNTALANQATATTSNMPIGFVVGNTATANVASTFIVDIMNYNGTSFIKEAIGVSQNWSSVTAAGEYVVMRAGRWNQTSAINSIAVGVDGGGNFMSGSIISGYVWP